MPRQPHRMTKAQYQQLSRKLAGLEQKQRKLNEMQTLVSWLSENVDNEEVSAYLVMSRINRLAGIAKEVGIVFPEEINKSLREWSNNVNKILEDRVQLKRSVKLFVDALFKPGAPQLKTVMCVWCEKHPAHFGGLCKRCADQFGVRPTGKVGENL